MTGALARGVLNQVSPGGRRWLSVLIYHRVLPAPDPLLPGLIDIPAFTQQVSTLSSSFNILPLQEAIARLAAGTLPPRAAAISFDDGYADNHDIVVPILRQFGVHATFFVATGYLDGGVMWNDAIIEAVRQSRHDAIDAGELGIGILPTDSEETRKTAVVRLVTRLKYLPARFRDDWTNRLVQTLGVTSSTSLMMTSEQVAGLVRSGMDVGCHTDTHPIFTKATMDDVRDQIVLGRKRLEDIAGRRVGLFAYPNGRPGIDFGPQHVRLVRELGFDAALSTRWGAAQSGDDLFQLPRFTSWGRSEFRFQFRMALNIMRSRLDLPSPPYWELSN
jgi:peptidoglycan/xylan/chitin deacetylase (PgdA/CDA1 family)